MLFKDRVDAGKKLADILFKKNLKNTVIVSLLRGGFIVGQEISNKLKTNHLPLVVVKISPFNQPELAIGAMCFDYTYLEPDIIKSLNIDKFYIRKCVLIAKQKFNRYSKKFNLNKLIYKIKNKLVILVDDGIATGSTIKTGLLFIKSLKPKRVILGVPVAPYNFETTGFDTAIILHRDTEFASVSQFYRAFPQVNDDIIKKLLYKL